VGNKESIDEDLKTFMALGDVEDRSPQKSMDNALENLRAGFPVIETRIPYIDESAKGLTRGEMSIIAGRPGNGKSSLAINIAMQLARNGNKVVFFSREMTKEQLMGRILSNELRIDSRQFRGKLSKTLDKTLSEHSPKILEKYKNLLIVDDVWELDGTLRILNTFEPDVFIDDYVQLTEGDIGSMKGDSPRFEIKQVLNAYKQHCKRLNMHGIIVSQMNREVEKRLTFVPMMSDLAEAAFLEHAAEMILFTMYPHVYNAKEDKNKFIVFCKKSRYGSVGTYEIVYEPEFQNFKAS